MRPVRNMKPVWAGRALEFREPLCLQISEAATRRWSLAGKLGANGWRGRLDWFARIRLTP